MFSFLFFLWSCFSISQDSGSFVELPPTYVFAEESNNKSPRSFSWPSHKSKMEETFIQPQVEEKLNSIPGVQSRLYQGSPTISIRGSAQSGRVLGLYNDIPLNFATGFGVPLVLFPKEIIGHTQVIKGPASLFYGSQAMAGSVNFLSRKINKPFVRLTLSDTDNSYLPWQGGGLAHNNWTLGLPLLQSEKHHLQASLFTENDDGQFPYSGKDNSGIRQNNDQNTNRLTLHGQNKMEGWKLSYDIVMGNNIRQTPGSLNFPLVTDEKTKAYLISLAPEVELNKHWNFKIRPSYLKLDSDFLDPTFGASFNKQETFITQATTEFVATENLSLKLFIDYFHHQLDSSFNQKTLSDDSFDLGHYLEWFLNPFWSLQGGFRFLFADEKLIPHLGLFYQRHWIKTWLSYSEGFRKATLSDRFANSSTFQANPELQPESSRQYELGMSWGNFSFQKPTTYTHRWVSEARLFYIDYDNFIERELVSGTLFTKKNRGEGKSYGLEWSNSYGFGPWEFFLNYSHLKTEDNQTGQAFALSPEHQINWGFFHYIGPLKFEAQNSLWRNYYDRDFSNTLIALEDWSQWNFLIHSYGFRSFNFSLGVLNIFNENKELTFGYPEPQRRYWAQMTYEF